MRAPQRFTAYELKNWNSHRFDDKSRLWKPARPLFPFIKIVQRVKLALMVLIGRFDALDWEDA